MGIRYEGLGNWIWYERGVGNGDMAWGIGESNVIWGRGWEWGYGIKEGFGMGIWYDGSCNWLCYEKRVGTGDTAWGRDGKWGYNMSDVVKGIWYIKLKQSLPNCIRFPKYVTFDRAIMKHSCFRSYAYIERLWCFTPITILFLYTFYHELFSLKHTFFICISWWY